MTIRKLAILLIICAVICTLAGCNRDPKARALRFVQSGQHYFDKGQYEPAAIEFRRAIQANPKAAEGYYQLGITDLKLHNLPDAYRSLTKATELDPNHTSALTQLAALKQVARRTDESRALLQKVLSLDPANLDARMLLGTASLEDHQYAEALSEFQAAQQIAPKDARVLAEIGDSYLLLKQQANAIAAYQAAIQLNKAYLPAFMNLAQIYRIQGNVDLETATLQDALQSNPKEIAPYLSLAQSYVRHGSGEKLETLFSDLRRESNNSALASLAISDFYHKIGDNGDAKTELQQLLAKYPKSDPARMKLIEIDIERQEWDEAQKLDDQMLQLHPKNPDIRLFHSRLLFVRGKKSEAISDLEALLHDVPDMALAHFYLGLAYAEEGQSERAIASYNEAISHNADLITAYVALGELYSRLGDAKLALEFANKALTRNPGLISALLLQANSLLQLGDAESAQKHLTVLAKSQPNSPVVLERLGFVAVKQKQLSEAEIEFEKSLKAKPDYVPALIDLVQVYSLQKRSDRIVTRIKQQIELAPKQSKFYEMLGSIYTQSGDLKDAEEVLTNGLGQDPNSDGAKLQLARIYAATGRSPLAIQNVRDVLQRHDKYSAGYLLLGTLYEQAGSPADAQKAYEDALKIDPNYAPALNNLAWIYCENHGNLDLALSLAQRAKESLPTEASVSDTLAWIEYRKGLYGPAVQELQDVARKNPNNALYQYHLGMAQLKMGNSNAARECLQRALGENLGASYLESAKAALTELGGKSL